MTAALEAAVGFIAEANPDMPPCIVLIGDGERGKKRVNGHFGAWRWNHDGDQVHELVVASQRFADGPAQVLETLLHEAAHALCAARGVKDTSRQGRFHNAKYKAAAIEVGLSVEQGENGWNLTDLADGTVARYQEAHDILADALRGFVAWGERERPKARQSQIPGFCECGRVIRASLACWEEAPIRCMECDQDFAPDANRVNEARMAAGRATIGGTLYDGTGTPVTDYLRGGREPRG